jgi:hypothetical protein
MTRSRHPREKCAVGFVDASIHRLPPWWRILGKLAHPGAENDSCNGCRNALETVVL